MKVEIPQFKEFPDSDIAGGFIVNPYWLEYLLNMYFQGFYFNLFLEIKDTKLKNSKSIENQAYGIIAQEVYENDKKQ